MPLVVLCHLKYEQVTELLQSSPRAPWEPLLGFIWAKTATLGSWATADERACFSSLQAVGTSTVAPAPAPAKASKLFQLRPKSPQVMPVEEFEGKRKALGWISPPPGFLSLPPLGKKKCQTRTSDARLRKPSQSSWVTVRWSLSPLRSSLLKGAGGRQESEAQWAGTGQAEQLPEIACPGSPGRCGPGAHLGGSKIGDTGSPTALLGHLEAVSPSHCPWRDVTGTGGHGAGMPPNSSWAQHRGSFLRGLPCP